MRWRKVGCKIFDSATGKTERQRLKITDYAGTECRRSCVTRPVAPALTQLWPEPVCKHKHWHVLAFEHLDCPFCLSFRRLRGTLRCQIFKLLGRHRDEMISSCLGFGRRFFSSVHLEITWLLSDQWNRIDHFQLKSEGPHDFYGIQILQLERVESMLVPDFCYDAYVVSKLH